jgi:hypothetical protein
MATVYILTRLLILLPALRCRTLRHLIEHWIRTRSQLMQNCITSSVYLSPYSFKRYPRCLLAKRRKVSLRSGCLTEDTRSDHFIYFFCRKCTTNTGPGHSCCSKCLSRYFRFTCYYCTCKLQMRSFCHLSLYLLRSVNRNRRFSSKKPI